MKSAENGEKNRDGQDAHPTRVLFTAVFMYLDHTQVFLSAPLRLCVR